MLKAFISIVVVQSLQLSYLFLTT